MKKQKLTKHDKLYKRKLHKPNKFFYTTLYFLSKIVYRKYNMKFNIIDNPKLEKENFIILGNHANRNDFLFTAIPLYPKIINFVSGYNEFFRSNLAPVFKLLQIVPKRQFCNDPYTVFEIISLVKKQNANLAFYPEGLATIFGDSMPCAIGTGKLIKFLNKPVYTALTYGAFLLEPKHKFMKKDRYAKTETTIKKLFSKEDLANLSPNEIEDKINEALRFDDYKWAKENKVFYKDNKDPIAEGFETILYKCPKCNKEFTIKAKDNKLYCENCHNEAIILNDYEIKKNTVDSKIPKSITDWVKYIRVKIKEEVSSDPNYKLEVKATLSLLPLYRYFKKKEFAVKYCEGILTLSKKMVSLL